MSSVAEALATARRAKGLTQEALASAADVTQVSISRYERESRVPEDDVLDRLASALGVTPVFLRAAGKPRGAWAIDVHLRRRATAKPGIWRRLEAQLNMLRQHARYLYEEINVLSEQSVPTFDPVFTEPEAAARMTRMQWRMPVGPVEQLMDWLEAAGCLVVERDFGTERVDGLSQWVDDHPILYLNATAPTDRKRLTAAHELGHLSLHTTDISEDMEDEANRFAAEFLMPADMIRSELRNVTLGRLFDLKRVWGVSVQSPHRAGVSLGVAHITAPDNLVQAVECPRLAEAGARIGRAAAGTPQDRSANRHDTDGARVLVGGYRESHGLCHGRHG